MHLPPISSHWVMPQWDGILAALVLVVCLGCQESGAPQPATEAVTHRVRQMEETQWLVDTLIGGEPDDTTLFLPGFMAFENGYLLVYDYGDARLKAFDPSGAWLWSFGHFGDGPGEFRNPADVIVGPDGLLWVLDQGAGRITRVSPAGELVDIIPLGMTAWRILPTSEEVFVFPADASDVFFQSVSTSGDLGRPTEYPTQQLVGADWRLRFVEATAFRAGGWAAALRQADLFLAYRDDALQCMGMLTAGAPVTRQWAASDNVFESLVSIGWQRAGLEVYSRALPDSTTVFIDRYDADDCAYEASAMLSVPGIAVSVEPGDDSYFILSRDPLPAIYEARRRPS